MKILIAGTVGEVEIDNDAEVVLKVHVLPLLFLAGYTGRSSHKTALFIDALTSWSSS